MVPPFYLFVLAVSLFDSVNVYELYKEKAQGHCLWHTGHANWFQNGKGVIAHWTGDEPGVMTCKQGFRVSFCWSKSGVRTCKAAHFCSKCKTTSDIKLGQVKLSHKVRVGPQLDMKALTLEGYWPSTVNKAWEKQLQWDRVESHFGCEFSVMNCAKGSFSPIYNLQRLIMSVMFPGTLWKSNLCKY